MTDDSYIMFECGLRRSARPPTGSLNESFSQVGWRDRHRVIAGRGQALADDIKIAHVYGKTGALEAYAKQSQIGLMLGLEYETGGTMEVNGNKLVVIEKDTQLKPDVGKAMLAEAYGDDDAAIAVGPVSSGVALALLPVAQEYQKILLVEPAVADSITGSAWNRYIFRSLADRIIVLHNGKLVADGEPAAVIASPIVQRAYLGLDSEEAADE